MKDKSFYDPFDRWQRMDNYIKAFISKSKGIDDELLEKLQHFRVQYLLKVASIAPEEAILFQRDISPWSPLTRGNYHRCYSNSNSLLEAIESKIALLSCIATEKFVLINDQKLHDNCTPFINEIRGQKILILPPGLEREGTRSLMARSGHTPSIQDAAKTAARLGLEMPNLSSKFPQKRGSASSFDQFLKHPTFRTFRQFGKKSFSASVVADIIEGFLTISLDERFQKKKGTPLLQDSYGRILYFLDQSMNIPFSEYTHLPKFENFIELVYEEILLWLMIAEPYSNGDLAKRIQENIHPAPFLRTVQSGMSAFSEVVQVLLKKESTIIYFDDCYFEGKPLLKGVNSYAVHFPDYEKSLLEQIHQLDGKKIDLLFVDFHNNFLPGKLKTEKHEVKSILSKVLPFGSNSFTLVIDNTIGFLNSDEIRDLIQTFPNQNLIVLWSHQKFDLFGVDKVSGGSYCVYSRNEVFLDQFRNLRGGEIDSASRQLLTHLFTFSVQKLEERKEKIFSNAWYVNQRIDPNIEYVVQKKDRLNFSVDVNMEGISEKELLILKEFRESGIPLMTRLGFGFNTISQSCIQDVMRFSIGIENQEQLDEFIQAFNAIFLPITQTHNDLRQNAEKLG